MVSKNEENNENNQSNLTADEEEKESSDAEQTDSSVLKEYIIQKGDTLTSISMSQYGTLEMIDEICRINDISREDFIFPGQKIVLPEE